jgi:hypothetical protein
MTPGDFNWFLHTMLFYHTQRVIQRQQDAMEQMADDVSSDESGDESDDEE